VDLFVQRLPGEQVRSHSPRDEQQLKPCCGDPSVVAPLRRQRRVSERKAGRRTPAGGRALQRSNCRLARIGERPKVVSPAVGSRRVGEAESRLGGSGVASRAVNWRDRTKHDSWRTFNDASRGRGPARSDRKTVLREGPRLLERPGGASGLRIGQALGESRQGGISMRKLATASSSPSPWQRPGQHDRVEANCLFEHQTVPDEGTFASTASSVRLPRNRKEGRGWGSGGGNWGRWSRPQSVAVRGRINLKPDRCPASADTGPGSAQLSGYGDQSSAKHSSRSRTLLPHVADDNFLAGQIHGENPCLSRVHQAAKVREDIGLLRAGTRRPC
jgi:hypothetical protein